MCFLRCNHRNFQNHWSLEVFRKKLQKNMNILIFHLKIDLYRWKKIFFQFKIEYLYSDRSELDLSDEMIRIKNFPFSRKLWWKNCRKLAKLIRCRKAQSFQTIKDIEPYRVSKFNVHIFYNFREISYQRVLRSGRAGPC